MQSKREERENSGAANGAKEYRSRTCQERSWGQPRVDLGDNQKRKKARKGSRGTTKEKGISKKSRGVWRKEGEKPLKGFRAHVKKDTRGRGNALVGGEGGGGGRA